MATSALFAAGAALCAGYAVGHAVSRRARRPPAALRGGQVFAAVSLPGQPRDAVRDVCAFCNMAFQAGDECTIMGAPCSHVFHARCLERYNKQPRLQLEYVAHCPRCHVAARVSALTTFAPQVPASSHVTKSVTKSLTKTATKSVSTQPPPVSTPHPAVSTLQPPVSTQPQPQSAGAQSFSVALLGGGSSTALSVDASPKSSSAKAESQVVSSLVKRTTVDLRGGRTCSLCKCASCAEGTDGACKSCGRCKCRGCVQKGCACACTCVQSISQFRPEL